MCMDDWETQNDSIIKEFSFQDFSSAMTFVNKVAELAEQVKHHPDILIHSYNKVRVKLSTHSEKAVTEKDIALAEMIDRIRKNVE